MNSKKVKKITKIKPKIRVVSEDSPEDHEEESELEETADQQEIKQFTDFMTSPSGTTRISPLPQQNTPKIIEPTPRKTQHSEETLRSTRVEQFRDYTEEARSSYESTGGITIRSKTKNVYEPALQANPAETQQTSQFERTLEMQDRTLPQRKMTPAGTIDEQESLHQDNTKDQRRRYRPVQEGG